jgi:hypothetical protein
MARGVRERPAWRHRSTTAFAPSWTWCLLASVLAYCQPERTRRLSTPAPSDPVREQLYELLVWAPMTSTWLRTARVPRQNAPTGSASVTKREDKPG